MKIISPTGFGVREEDEWGRGCFRAPRGDKLHKGADFALCKPGEKLVGPRSIYSPCTGKVIREVWPYPDGKYRGILIANHFGDFMMFYFVPFPNLLRPVFQKVNIGQEIGLAQDISKRDLPDKYPGMIPHIHLQIEVHKKNLYSGGSVYIDPEVLM